MMDKYLSEDTDKRWVWLSTVVALAILISLPLFVGAMLFGYTAVASIGQAWFVLYSTAVLMALVYSFGREALRTVYQYRNGGFSIEDRE